MTRFLESEALRGFLLGLASLASASAALAAGVLACTAVTL